MQTCESVGESSFEENNTPSVGKNQVSPTIKAFKSPLPRVPVKEQIITGTGNTKTSYNYVNMIVECILRSNSKRVLLSDIYKFVQNNYREMIDKGVDWQNGIRHNLSLNDCFYKDGRNPNGKGYFWAIRPKNLKYFLEGDFCRRWSQSRTRRKNSKETRYNKNLIIQPENNPPVPSPNMSFPIHAPFAVCERGAAALYQMYDQPCMNYIPPRFSLYPNPGSYVHYYGMGQLQDFHEKRATPHQLLQFQPQSDRMPRPPPPSYTFNHPYNYCLQFPTSDAYLYLQPGVESPTGELLNGLGNSKIQKPFGEPPYKYHSYVIQKKLGSDNDKKKCVISDSKAKQATSDQSLSPASQHAKHPSYDMDYILRKL